MKEENQLLGMMLNDFMAVVLKHSACKKTVKSKFATTFI